MKNGKKEKSVVVLSALLMLISLIILIFPNGYVMLMAKLIKDITGLFQIKIINDFITTMLETPSKLEIIIQMSICFISCFILLIILLKGKLLEKKKMVIFLLVIVFLISIDKLVLLGSLVNIIIVISLKNKKASAKTNKSKTDIKTLKYWEPKMTNRRLILSVVLLLAYLTINFWYPYIPIIFNSNVDSIIVDVCFIVLSIVVFNKQIFNGLKMFKNNFKVYFKWLLPKIGIMYALLICSNIILKIFNGNITDSVNQQILEELPILYLIFGSIIYAPLVEEILMRGVIRKLFKNNIIFIIVSGLTFGLLHTVYEANVYAMLIQSLPYVITGCFLAYIYVKTNNICANIFCHMFNNTLAIILMGVNTLLDKFV